MSELQSHYPDFDVMRQAEHWDDHTRQIVEKRLKENALYPCNVFSQQEANTLAAFCMTLLNDERYPVIAFVVHHFDTQLHANIGESQRQIGLPEQSKLIREGLELLDQHCMKAHGTYFDQLGHDLQVQMVKQMFAASLELKDDERQIPVKAFINKIFTEAVSAYYSHPTVWSEIGYAGPAYPRGYVRSELGLTDPWEAKRHDKS